MRLSVAVLTLDSGHLPDKFHGGAAGVESWRSCCSSLLLRPPVSRSLSQLFLEEDGQETNVDTGVPAAALSQSRTAGQLLSTGALDEFFI